MNQMKLILSWCTLIGWPIEHYDLQKLSQMNSHVVLEENNIWNFWHLTLFPSGLDFDKKVKPYKIFDNLLKGPMPLVGRIFFFLSFPWIFFFFFLSEEKHFCNFWRIIMNKSILIEIVGLKETVFNWAFKGVRNVTKDPNAPSQKFSLKFFFFLSFWIFLWFFLFLFLFFLHQTKHE